MAFYSNVPNASNTIVVFCLFVFLLFVCVSECGPVGVEDRNKIPDARMTAGTYYDSRYYPYQRKEKERWSVIFKDDNKQNRLSSS